MGTGPDQEEVAEDQHEEYSLAIAAETKWTMSH